MYVFIYVQNNFKSCRGWKKTFPSVYISQHRKLESVILWKDEGILGSGDNPSRRINEGTFHSTSQKEPSGKTVKADLLLELVSVLERCTLDLTGKITSLSYLLAFYGVVFSFCLFFGFCFSWSVIFLVRLHGFSLLLTTQVTNLNHFCIPLKILADDGGFWTSNEP